MSSLWSSPDLSPARWPLAAGVVALAHGWGDPADERDIDQKGSNVQRLVPADQHYDRETGLALQSAIPVNVRPQSNAVSRMRKSG